MNEIKINSIKTVRVDETKEIKVNVNGAEITFHVTVIDNKVIGNHRSNLSASTLSIFSKEKLTYEIFNKIKSEIENN